MVSFNHIASSGPASIKEAAVLRSKSIARPDFSSAADNSAFTGSISSVTRSLVAVMISYQINVTIQITSGA